MRQDKYKYQVGDKLYKLNVFTKEIEEWTIEKIFIEQYVQDYKPILYMTTPIPESELKTGKEYYLSDVLFLMYDTETEAKYQIRDIKEDRECVSKKKYELRRIK